MPIAAEDLLAGPILRRVEPDLLSVWIALRKPASVRLEVYRDVGAPASLGPPIPQIPRPAVTTGRRGLPPDPHTLAVGANLHIAVAVFEPEPPARLDWGGLYSYNLWFTADDGGPPVDLAGLALLRDGTLQNHLGVTHEILALGYQPDWLPSVAMPAAEPLGLKIAHGSCRWSVGPGRDALPIMDELIGQSLGDPAQRPQMLWLTGDQIYADANGPEHGVMLNQIGHELLSRDATVIEWLPIRFDPEPGMPIVRFPLDLTHFPPGRRLHLLQYLPGNAPEDVVRGFTSKEQDAHVAGFSEYCANYLTAFSNTLWPELRPLLQARFAEVQAFIDQDTQLRDAIEDAPRTVRRPQQLDEMRDYWNAWRLVPPYAWAIDDHLTEIDRWVLWDEAPLDGPWTTFWKSVAQTPGMSGYAHLATTPGPPPSPVAADPDRHKLARALTPLWMAGRESYWVELNEAGEIVGDKVHERLHNLKAFHDGLARVRRVLANVPTYMVFDDHDLCDDWNVTSGWVTAVRGNVLGRTILRNGLAALLLFQAWGNDPRKYVADGVPRRLLEGVSRMFMRDDGAPEANGPFLGIDQRSNLDALDRELDNQSLFEPTPAPDERMHWHFRYDGPGYEIVALDTRTWRSYERDADPTIGQPFTTEANAPLVTDEALRLQIPPDPPAGVNPSGLCIVVSAVPVLGFPPVESLAQPILNLNDIIRPLPTGRWAKHKGIDRRGRINYDPEPWGYVPRLFEALLARLSSRRRVVILSGDVHYSLMMEMAYWRRQGNAVTSTRFVQCTGSSYRAQQPTSRIEYFTMDLVQQIATEIANGIERLGWRKGLVGALDEAPPVVAPAGERFNDRVEYLLQIDPIVLSPQALPPGTTYDRGPDGAARVAEWAWRMRQVLDERPDLERLVGQVPPLLLPPSSGWPEMLRSAANRVVWSVEHAADRRWMWWNNATVVDFIGGPVPEVRQSVYCYDPSNPEDVPRPFMVTHVPLDVPSTVTIPTVPPEPPEDQ